MYTFLVIERIFCVVLYYSSVGVLGCFTCSISAAFNLYWLSSIAFLEPVKACALFLYVMPIFDLSHAVQYCSDHDDECPC